jgi:hypothetical protein
MPHWNGAGIDGSGYCLAIADCNRSHSVYLYPGPVLGETRELLTYLFELLPLPAC